MNRIFLGTFLLACVMTTNGAFAQANPPTFEDDLLDHLVGKWDATGTVHGRPSSQAFDVDWVLNHQYLRIQETSAEIVAGTNLQFESLLFIGYDKTNKRHILHSMSVWGGGRAGEFVFGERSGNKVRFTDTSKGRRGHSAFIWEPESKTWRYISGLETDKGEFTATVELKLTRNKAGIPTAKPGTER
jgi:hypothetical protein